MIFNYDGIVLPEIKKVHIREKLEFSIRRSDSRTNKSIT